MENKEQLIVAIRRWLSLDNEIAQLNQTLKEKRNEKKELTESLTGVMNAHDIDCFNSRQAKLIKARRKVKIKYYKEIFGSNFVRFLWRNREFSCR